MPRQTRAEMIWEQLKALTSIGSDVRELVDEPIQEAVRSAAAKAPNRHPHQRTDVAGLAAELDSLDARITALEAANADIVARLLAAEIP